MRLYVATFALLLFATAANAQNVDVGDPTYGGTSLDQSGGMERVASSVHYRGHPNRRHITMEPVAPHALLSSVRS